ncbi:acyl-CoA dehydrogenase family protein, partial [Nocardia carnea]|uniref:acyl-CoA dehydrogenase family protein n=1 Tax=Nocardia carnea TaxID=37328 RepID=UPI002454A747
MDFTRDEAQEAVAEVVVGLLEREAARDSELWPKLAATGLLSVALPERFGGDDMGIDAVSVLLTELATDAVAAAPPAPPGVGGGGPVGGGARQVGGGKYYRGGGWGGGEPGGP